MTDTRTDPYAGLRHEIKAIMAAQKTAAIVVLDHSYGGRPPYVYLTDGDGRRCIWGSPGLLDEVPELLQARHAGNSEGAALRVCLRADMPEGWPRSGVRR